MADLVWITGASSGIGAALGHELSARGINVVASARRRVLLDAIATTSPGPGVIHPWPLDVTDGAAMLAAACAIEAAHGSIGTVVLNAGAGGVADRPFVAGDLDALMALNVMGVAHGIEAVLPAMRARGRGRIVIVASLAGYRGLPRAAFYGATKAALIHLAEALRFELRPSGIIVQLVNPGFVATPLTQRNDFKMPLLMTAAAAAKRVADGMAGDRFEIIFPRRLAYLMKLLRLLPYRIYFPLMAAGTRRRR